MARKKHRKKKYASKYSSVSEYKLLAKGVRQNPNNEHKDRYIIDYLVDRYSDISHEVHIEEEGNLEKRICGSDKCELDYFSIYYGKCSDHCIYVEAKSTKNGVNKAKNKQIPRGIEYISSTYHIPKSRIKSYVVWGDKENKLYIHEVKK